MRLCLLSVDSSLSIKPGAHVRIFINFNSFFLLLVRDPAYEDTKKNQPMKTLDRGSELEDEIDNGGLVTIAQKKNPKPQKKISRQQRERRLLVLINLR